MINSRTSSAKTAAWLTFRPAGSGAPRSSRATLLCTAVTGTVLAMALAPSPARANNECGVADSGTIFCTPAGNPYPNGIEYQANGDMTVVLQPNVVVDSGASSGVLLSSPVDGVSGTVIATVGSEITSNETGIALGFTTPDGGNATIINAATVTAGETGLSASANVDARIVNSGDVTIFDKQFGAFAVSNGIEATGSFGNVSVMNSGDLNVTGSRDSANGIIASNASASGLEIVNSGAITVTGLQDAAARGIFVSEGADAGFTSISSSGPISVSSSTNATGVRASLEGSAAMDFTGRIEVTGESAFGISVGSSQSGNLRINATDIAVTALGNGGGSSGAGISVLNGSGATVIDSGTINTVGFLAAGIDITTNGEVIVQSDSIQTSGYASSGIDVGRFFLGKGSDVSIVSGSIVTAGNLATGIDVGTDGILAITSGDVITNGVQAAGIRSNSFGTNGTSIDANFVRTAGEGSVGILVDAALADVAITNGIVSTAGADSLGIQVTTGGNATVSVATGASTQGDRSDAVAVTADGDIAIDVHFASTDGLTSDGINASSTSGNVAIVSGSNGDGGVVTSGLFANGIRATAAAGTVTIENAGGITTSSADSRGIYARGDAGVTITGRGAILTEGAFSDGIDAEADNGAVSVIAGDVATVRESSSGILAIGFGNAAVDASSASTQGDFSRGIVASSETGTASVSVVDVTTRGDFAAGVGAIGAVSATVTAGTITTAGLESTGAAAVSEFGTATAVVETAATDGESAFAVAAIGGAAATVQVASASTTGESANGATAGSANGLATVRAGTVTTNGADAIGISANGNTALVEARFVSTTGANSHAIFGESVNDQAIVAERAMTAGARADAILADTAVGDVDITVNRAMTAGTDARAVAVTTGGSANISVGLSAVTLDEGSDAINVVAEGDVSIDSQFVSTSGDDSDGISFRSTNGNIVIVSGAGAGDAGVVTAGEASDGIEATALAGTVLIDNQGGVTTTGGLADGISARGNDGVTITGRGTIATQAAGIFANSDFGPISILAGDVTTLGDASRGITGIGFGAVAIDAFSVSTQGEFSIGILADSAESTSSIKAVNVTTTGDEAIGITARSNVQATIVAGNVTTAGVESTGVEARSQDGIATVRVDSVSTSGASASGIVANGGAAASVEVGSITTTGNSAFGASASSLDGPVSVRAGSVATTGDDAVGIYAAGNSALTDAGVVTTTGANSHGILSESREGLTILVQSSDVTGANANAINAWSRQGPVTITSRKATALDAAIVAHSDLGAVTLNLSGLTTSATDDAVQVTAGTSAMVNLAADALLLADDDGITVTSGTGTTVNNAGVILISEGFAVDAAGGATTINNSGTLAGRVRLTGNADNFNNSGAFNANRTSEFGAGNDVLNNNGLMAVSADQSFGTGTDTFNNSGTLRAQFPPAGIIAFSGLEATNNSGSINLVNARTGDTLNLGGTFTGSGNSNIVVDVNLALPSAADRMVVGTALGSTAVQLNRLDAGNIPLGTGAVVVQAAASSTPTAFTLAGGPIEQGLVQLAIVYNPDVFSYTLTGSPTDVAYRTLTFVEAARSLWHKSAEAWSGQMREARDTASSAAEGQASGRFWMQGYGSAFDRDLVGSFTAFNVTDTVDLSYGQDFFGTQIGFDFVGGIGADGGFALGITGGYLNSRVNFDGAGDDLSFSAWNAGAYARFVSGPIFVNALGKYDKIDGEVRSIAGGFEADLDGSAYGAQAEVGLRFGTNVTFEPSVSLSWVKTQLDGFSVTGTDVSFEEEDGLRGRAGARVGVPVAMRGASGLFYAGAHYVHEFQGRDSVRLSNANTAVTFRNGRTDDYVEGLVGLNIASESGISGFFEANTVFKDRQGLGARAGLRVRF